METGTETTYGTTPHATAQWDVAALQRLWADLPQPEWTEERAERIFQGVMREVHRRQRRRERLMIGAALALPLALLAASHALRSA
jgi:hypothetical protein